MGGKHFNSSALQKRKGARAPPPQTPQRTNPRTGVNFHRHGAEAARGAHNSEVTRSKRVAGIIQFVRFTEPDRQLLGDAKHSTTTFTGVAQRERAVLITPRSLVQTQPPVSSNSSALQNRTVNC